MRGQYFDVFFTPRSTNEQESRPLMTVFARDAREAKEKANQDILSSGRSRSYDLAWTLARVAKTPVES